MDLQYDMPTIAELDALQNRANAFFKTLQQYGETVKAQNDDQQDQPSGEQSEHCSPIAPEQADNSMFDICGGCMFDYQEAKEREWQRLGEEYMDRILKESYRKTCVGTLETLGRTPDDWHALSQLHWVVGMVEPIMMRRGWYTPMVKEFYPDDEKLRGQHQMVQNKDGGRKSIRIDIRLRSTLEEWGGFSQFLSDAVVTDAMLHELAKFVQGDQGEGFDAVLMELRAEYKEFHGAFPACNDVLG